MSTTDGRKSAVHIVPGPDAAGLIVADQWEFSLQEIIIEISTINSAPALLLSPFITEPDFEDMTAEMELSIRCKAKWGADLAQPQLWLSLPVARRMAAALAEKIAAIEADPACADPAS